ncbi:MAG: Mandelate racemase/muconate lactonizing protein [Chthonomonadales bacterium]|nr:Mandelate racemase/muconate lactonizing protein [Chthonomonadales bacterium]
MSEFPLIIESIETVQVPPRWGLLRLRLMGGMEGFGEYTVEGQLDGTEALVRELSHHFIGKDARDLKRLVRGVYDQSFYHGGPHFMSALAGIEIALWDVMGKAIGQPIHRLLGGKVRDKVKVYRWAGGNNESPEVAAEEAAMVVSQGARAIKMNACPPLAAIDTYGGIRSAVARARAVREAVGPDIDIAFDFHGRCNVPMARRLVRELEFANPLFYEEPVRPDYNRWLPEITRLTHVPIATGERIFTVAEFSDVVANQGAHILQPDLVHVGGISNAAEVASLAEANGLALAPHCPLSPIAFMACLHVVAQSRAGWILEWAKGIHYNASGATGDVDPWLRFVAESDWPLFEVDETGHLPISDLPGLGVTIDWAEVQRAAKNGVIWRDMEMSLPDGTKANW